MLMAMASARVCVDGRSCPLWRCPGKRRPARDIDDLEQSRGQHEMERVRCDRCWGAVEPVGDGRFVMHRR